MTRTESRYMDKEWLNGSQALSIAFDFASKHMYGHTTIGFELRGENGRTYNFALKSGELSIKAIKDRTGLYDFNYLTRMTIYDLRDKEYDITRYGIEVKRGYEKLYDLLDGKEYGAYVVINGNDIFEIEYMLTSDGITRRRTFADFDSVVERLEDAVTKNLRVLYVPKYHMWEKCSYEMYPDDPGCGMYGYYVKVTDKATGVEYQE